MIEKNHRFHGLGSLRPVYKQGKTVRCGEISLRYNLNPQRHDWRAAVVVSKKVHKSAVRRNRLRRRIFEIIRQNEQQIAGPYDLVVSVFSDQVIDWPDHRLNQVVKSLFEKAGTNKPK